MPGHHVTDHQMRTFMNHRKTQSTEAAAAKAGFSTATGSPKSRSGTDGPDDADELRRENAELRGHRKAQLRRHRCLKTERVAAIGLSDLCRTVNLAWLDRPKHIRPANEPQQETSRDPAIAAIRVIHG